MRGFVNISLDRKASISTIINRINNVSNVQFAHLVTGQVDAIAYIDASDADGFSQAVLAINRIPGVIGTTTNVALSAVQPTARRNRR